MIKTGENPILSGLFFVFKVWWLTPPFLFSKGSLWFFFLVFLLGFLWFSFENCF